MSKAEQEIKRLEELNTRQLISKVMDQLAELKQQITLTKDNSEVQVTEAIQILQLSMTNFMEKQLEKIEKYLELRIESSHKHLALNCSNVETIQGIDKRLTKLEIKVEKRDKFDTWMSKHGYKVVGGLILIIFGLLSYLAFIK
jgi:hypothetical protein